MYQRYIKRLLDFILSLLAIIVLSPILLIVALLVKTKLGSPVIFKQQRPGMNEKIFTMYKFRTMTDEMDEQGNLLPDIQRLTRLGKFLRNTSVDELPELFNILKGEMSFVGPRPLLVKYLYLYNNKQKQRHLVRPGLTGLAQIKGRNDCTWNERFENDLLYITNVTIMEDIKIILSTIKSVFFRKGIDSNTTNVYTMKEFSGNERE